jgi:hypothetical protein
MKEFLAFCFVVVLAAQTVPVVKNGQVETRSFSGDLAATLKSDKPMWFGYSIKTQRRSNGNYNWCDGQHQNPIQLEGSDSSALLFRVENNQVEKIHLYNMDCAYDVGGLPFVWLTGVSTEASLAYLQNLSTDNAVFAISQHEGTHATDILLDKAKNNPSTHVREQAIFWLAQRAGTKAVAAIVDAITNDPDTGVKKKAVFALSQLPKDEGVPKLIEIAKTQRNPEVRKQAFFWLGQTHDPRALAYIEDVLSK